MSFDGFGYLAFGRFVNRFDLGSGAMRFWRYERVVQHFEQQGPTMVFAALPRLFFFLLTVERHRAIPSLRSHFGNRGWRIAAGSRT